MNELVSTITSEGQVTIPLAVRRHLGVGSHDRVAFVIDGEDVKLRPVAFTIESVRGSVPALPGRETIDFADQIEEAKEERAAELVRRMSDR